MLSKVQLKEKLLTCQQTAGKYIDNIYLDEYINLIINYKLMPGYSEVHHIQPRTYYQYNNLNIDSSDNNCIRLLYKDHIKAHYLLYFCTTDRLQQANAAAVQYCMSVLRKNIKQTNNIEADLTELQSYMDKIIADGDSRYWTDDEIRLLYKLKPKKTNAKIADLESLFPGRSYACILKKANSLGIFIKPSQWTDYENNILITYFPSEGNKVALRLPNRTEAACIRQARLLGLHHSRLWTDGQILVLKTYYPIEGKNVSERLPGHSKAACAMKAKELGIAYKDTWTAEMIAILQQFYPIEGAAVGQRINKSTEACRQKASKLKLKYKGNR